MKTEMVDQLAPQTWGETNLKTCKDCEYFNRQPGNEQNGQQMGQCFRYAPSPFMLKMSKQKDNRTGQWGYVPEMMAMQNPIVAANYGCGDYCQKTLIKVPPRN